MIDDQMCIPKTHLHTTVPGYVYRKVKEYGKGNIGEGITNLVNIAESKITVRIITEIFSYIHCY